MSNRSARCLAIPLLVVWFLLGPGLTGDLQAEGTGDAGLGNEDGGAGPRWVEEREFPPEPTVTVKTVLLAPFRLPELLLSVGAWPILKFLEYEEEYAVVQRTYDLFSSEDGTVFYFPYMYYFTADNLTVGATYLDNDVFHRGRKYSMSADTSTGGGRSASISFTRPGDAVSPLSYSLRGGYGKDVREKFYGIGNETDRESKSVFEEESVGISLDIGRKMRTFPFFKPTLHLEYLSGKTAESSNPGASDSIVENFGPETLTGFGERMNLALFGLSLKYNSRIPFHEPSRGQKLELNLMRAESLDGSPYGYTTFHLGFTQLINLYRGNRVLALGFQFETTEGFGDEVPFNHLSHLDKGSPLRGFPGGRFRDNGYLLFNLEYSFPVWRAKGTGNISMLGTFFLDGGKTFSDISQFDEGKLHYSSGTGLAISLPGSFYYRMQAAGGGEGIQFMAAFNRSF